MTRLGGTDAQGCSSSTPTTRITADLPARNRRAPTRSRSQAPEGTSVDVPADDFTYYEDFAEVGKAVVASPASTSIAITPGFAIHSGDVIVAMVNANGGTTTLTG